MIKASIKKEFSLLKNTSFECRSDDYLTNSQRYKKKVRWIAEAATNGVLYKKVFFKISQNSQETPVSEPATLLKKRLWYRYFLVNSAKFLRTLFLQKTSRQLPLGLAVFQKLVTWCNGYQLTNYMIWIYVREYVQRA